jgi:hypothetical protein
MIPFSWLVHHAVVVLVLLYAPVPFVIVVHGSPSLFGSTTSVTRRHSRSRPTTRPTMMMIMVQSVHRGGANNATFPTTKDLPLPTHNILEEEEEDGSVVDSKKSIFLSRSEDAMPHQPQPPQPQLSEPLQSLLTMFHDHVRPAVGGVADDNNNSNNWMRPPRTIAIVTMGPRDDAAASSSSSITTGGLLVLRSGRDSSSSSSYVFYPNKWRRSRGLPLLHTLALLADGIIVIIANAAEDQKKKEKQQQKYEPQQGGLVDGLIHRATIGGRARRGRLLVWLPHDDNDDNHQELVQPHLVVELAGLSPPESVVERYDVVADRSLLQQTIAEWTRELLHDDDRSVQDDVLVDDTDGGADHRATSLWPLIVQQAYQRLGGQEPVLLGPGISLGDIIVHQQQPQQQPPPPPPAVSRNDVPVPRGGAASANERQQAAPVDANAADNAANAMAAEISRALDVLQVLLHANELDDASMPIHFCQHASVIVEQLIRFMQQHQQKNNDRVVPYLQARLEGQDYFGRWYETMVDNNSNGSSPRVIRTLQERTIRSFRRAAVASIPSQTPASFDLTYVRALAGLSQDLQDMTDLRRDLTGDALAAADDDDDDETAPPTSFFMRRIWKNHPPVPKWFKSVLARALMLAVNYAQGWLALQGMRQAALERERNLPKIPLF